MEAASRVAVVTGSNRGIGRAVVVGLGEAGWTVFLCARADDVARREAAELRSAGLDVRPLRLDVADADSVRAAAAAVEREVGRVDLLVNNAGIGGDPDAERPGAADLDVIRRVFETNVFGVISVTEAMLPLLRTSRNARIVNVSSSTGSLALMSDPDHYFAGMPGWLGYPVSKAALNQITVQYAKQLRADNITVNAADPGPTDTAIVDAAPATVRPRPAAGRTPADGARVILALALGEVDGSSQFRREAGPVPW